MTMDRKHLTGSEGEAVAGRYLKKKGYTILGQNYFCRFGEIDLIARDGGYVVFVEVKTRTSSGFAQAREAVTPAKQRKLRAAASLYLAERRLDCRCRFDVAEVYWTSRRINYIINAF